MTDDDLARLFEDFGEVASANVITDRETGRSRGFGFVEMPNDDEARTALDALADHEENGRRLVINEARPRAPRGGGGGGWGGGGGRGGDRW